MRKSEAAYLARVAELGCVLCGIAGWGETPAQIHHPRASEGAGTRSQHWLAIPLCPEHHLGPQGVHGDRGALRQWKVDEWDLLAETIRRLNE